MGHSYDSQFMAYADNSSRYSAKIITTMLKQNLKPESVLDVGCARGTWLAAWRENGVEDVVGVDGSYVDPDTLAIPRARFFPADLATSFDLQRTFDLVQSLEVAEHVPAAAAECFVDNLTRHSRGFVLFSAAPPGQGGEHHVNEQAYEYWRSKFLARGYEAYDFIRPAVTNDKRVSFWYRYNALLYVRQDRKELLPAPVGTTKLERARRVPEFSPLAFRARKLVVRLLPYGLQQWLARVKARSQAKRV